MLYRYHTGEDGDVLCVTEGFFPASLFWRDKMQINTRRTIWICVEFYFEEKYYILNLWFRMLHIQYHVLVLLWNVIVEYLPKQHIFFSSQEFNKISVNFSWKHQIQCFVSLIIKVVYFDLHSNEKWLCFRKKANFTFADCIPADQFLHISIQQNLIKATSQQLQQLWRLSCDI